MAELTWQKGYEALPAAKQEEIDGWVGTNVFLAEGLGLDLGQWWILVEEAFQNPDDFSYLQKVEVYSDTDKLDEDGANARQVATKLGGPKKDLASIPKVGEDKPEGSLSLSMLNFPRRG